MSPGEKLYHDITIAINELEKYNEEQKTVIKLDDFRRTYDEGYVDAIEDTIDNMREILRNWRMENDNKSIKEKAKK